MADVAAMANRSIGRCDGSADGPIMRRMNSLLMIMIDSGAAISGIGIVLLLASGLASVADHNS